MTLHWDQNTPIYQQLRDRTVNRILSGELSEGDLLPSVRQVAVDLQVNPLTVSKAYQGLVDEALVEFQRGIGMRIKEGAKEKLLQAERQRFLSQDWPEVLERIAKLHLNFEELPKPLTQAKAQNS